MFTQLQFFKEIKDILQEFLDKDTTSIVLQYMKESLLNFDIANGASILYFNRHNILNKFWKHRTGGVNPIIKTDLFDRVAFVKPDLLLGHLQFLKNVCFINATSISFQFILETSTSSLGENKTKYMTIDWDAIPGSQQFYSIYDFLCGSVKTESNISSIIQPNTFNIAGYKRTDDRKFRTIILVGTDLDNTYLF
jgi:hypothetical protein